MSEKGYLIVLDIDYRLGQLVNTQITELLYSVLNTSLPRHLLNEVCNDTYKDMVRQIINCTSDNHADFCFNLLSLPNYTTLRYNHGEHHPFAYLGERVIGNLNFSIRDLGLSLFFKAKENKPSGMYLTGISHVDVNSIGLLYKPMTVESIL